ALATGDDRRCVHRPCVGRPCVGRACVGRACEDHVVVDVDSATGLAPEGPPNLAQRFSAGNRTEMNPSPVGTAEITELPARHRLPAPSARARNLLTIVRPLQFAHVRLVPCWLGELPGCSCCSSGFITLGTVSPTTSSRRKGTAEARANVLGSAMRHLSGR